MISVEQRQLLLDLIESRREIIEAKENNTVINLKKVDAWKELT